MSTAGPHGHGVHPMLDAIAEQAFGHTILFDQPLTDHGRKLMDALGVNVTYTRPKRILISNPQREGEE